MESKEEKKASEWSPVEVVTKALEALGIDHSDPGFSKEAAIAKFNEKAENEKDFEAKTRYQELAKICSEHKFWESQPVNQPF